MNLKIKLKTKKKKLNKYLHPILVSEGTDQVTDKHGRKSKIAVTQKLTQVTLASICLTYKKKKNKL